MDAQSAAALLLLLPLLACATSAGPGSPPRMDVLRADAVEQIDSLPAPTLRVEDRRLLVHGYIGLGATGYELVPSAAVEQGVIDLTITPRMPEGMAGLTVLTRYEYRLTTGALASGSYVVRVHHAREGGGNPTLAFEGSITVD